MTSLIDLFLTSVERFPQRPAVESCQGIFSYAQLLRLVEERQQQLLQSSLLPGQTVALVLPKSVDAIAWILAALKIGAHYLPLDPQMPLTRLEMIFEDARPAVILGHELGPWEKKSYGPQLGCILYTSGSTGRPKGVMIPQSAILAFARWSAQEVGLHCEDRVVSVAPFYFDLSLFDLFATFSVGATLILPPPQSHVLPPEFLRLLRAKRISTWYSVPTFFQHMLSVLDSDLPLDKIIFAGEVFPHPALCRLRQLFPRARMWNWYGPTETNVLTSYELAPGPPPYPLPLGRAVPYAQIELSAEGEILAQGASLMLGHLGQSPLGKIYATGDLGYFDQEGLLYFSGRRDSLIKSRGHRIELGEIKAALEAQAFEAEVIAVTDAEYGKKIIAFIKAPAPMREVWSGLKKRLPKYMMPVRIIELDDFPLSASGKKDLQALHQLYSSTSQ